MFAFDYDVKDRESGYMVSVWRDEKDATSLDFSVRSGQIHIHFYLGIDKAAEFAHAILAAIHNDHESQVALRATMETSPAKGA